MISGVDNIIVVYGGRFQPFHAGHADVYKWLVERFGKANVYIATSNRTDQENHGKKWKRGFQKGEEKAVKSPLNFREKKKLMIQMFDIPSNKIVQANDPTFNPKEVFEKKKLDPERTAWIAVVGDRTERSDAYRYIGVKNFRAWNNNLDKKTMYPKTHCGYYVVVPSQAKDLSGTYIRDLLKDPDIHQIRKKKIFERLYGKYNKEIFEMMQSRL